MFCTCFTKAATASAGLGLFLLSIYVPLSFCAESPPSLTTNIPPYQAIEKSSGGVTTVFDNSRNGYNLPAGQLSASEKVGYFSGHSFFKNPWVKAPATTTARDGLGPLFNTNSCKACHIRNGRGSVRDEGLLLRLSRPQGDLYVADRLYGGQLQHRSIVGAHPEGKWDIGWREYKVILTGGETVSLRAPLFAVSHWSHGEPDSETKWSARIAPAVIGLGLLEAIAERDILDYAMKQCKDPSPVAGRPSWVRDLESGQQRLGRFGWKALQPTVKQQSAKAFSEDMGLTSFLFPASVCTARQVQCQALPSGGEPEVSRKILDAVTYYSSQGGVPAPRNSHSETFKRGREQFYLTGCAQCHRPHWQTEATNVLAAQDIWPYTDLLLHDMGDALAAPGGEGEVSGSEWRTSPLWGVGLAKIVNPDTGFLHDGRARSLLEAILWHGGEAESSRQAVRLMSVSDREDLIYFLNSL
jgi:CxxC motif-containing protein (DUF1111 family)